MKKATQNKINKAIKLLQHYEKLALKLNPKGQNPSIDAFLSNCPIWQKQNGNVKIQIIISDSYESYNYTFVKGCLMVKNELVKPKI